MKINIQEIEEELKTLLRKEKDGNRHEKLQVFYWRKTQGVDTVLSDTGRGRKKWKFIVEAISVAPF